MDHGQVSVTAMEFRFQHFPGAKERSKLGCNGFAMFCPCSLELTVLELRGQRELPGGK